ncbi:MAG: serine hydrolase domain-containing protein, partial [Candidatus Aenigmatarchaeota archaeon]
MHGVRDLLKKCMEDGVAQGVFPGAVLLVFSRGDVVFFEAFGYSMVYPRERLMRKETFFDVASITKVVVTVSIVMMLVEKGVFHVDQSIKDFYPNIDNRKSNITISDLLSHSSGLPAWHPFYLELEEEEKKSGVRLIGEKKAWDFVINRIMEMELDYEPGSKHVYSDLGFILLGDIIRKVTGKGIAETFRQMVCAPLGMDGSFFRDKV